MKFFELCLGILIGFSVCGLVTQMIIIPKLDGIDTSAIVEELKDNNNNCEESNFILRNELYDYYKSLNDNSFEYYNNLRNEVGKDHTIYINKCEGTFESIATELNNAKPYKLNVFDCTEKAELLTEVYSDLGWDSKTKFVNMNCDELNYNEEYTFEDCESNNGGHLIVKINTIYVEATTGDIIKPEDYIKYGLK